MTADNARAAMTPSVATLWTPDTDAHEATTAHVYGERGIEVAHDHAAYVAHLREPSGRMKWVCYHQYESNFGPDHESVETWNDVLAPLGAQHGTFFKTSKVHEGMTVWLWGGRHPDDVPVITAHAAARQRLYERTWGRA